MESTFVTSRFTKAIALCGIALFAATSIHAQDNISVAPRQLGQSYGHTWNAGLGIGNYWGSEGSGFFIGANYEFDVARNFTLAPAFGLGAYSNAPVDDYYYRATVVPVGVKATYYFDDLVHAGPRWDFYGAGSLGVTFRTTVFDGSYSGRRATVRSSSPLYLDFHLGAEYKVSRHTGIFLDLSSGISTIGLAFHR